MRSISQIYSEAVHTRNNYLQLTELNTGRSNSKLSIINLLTYVVAVCIHTYEAVLDAFQIRTAEVLLGRINGTPDWYALMAKKFQFNNVTSQGDELRFNEDTLKIEYVQTDASHRIIEKAAWQLNDDSLILKVCKINDNSNEVKNGTPYMALNVNEMTAFKQFIQNIKFVGAKITAESLPGDIVTIIADSNNPIFYDDRYVTAAQALQKIQDSLIDFANKLDFNEYFYYQTILDVIRKTDYITDIGNYIKIYISSYNQALNQYDEPVELKNRVRLRSGYIRFLDQNSILTINSLNLTLLPMTQMDEYLSMIHV